MTTHEILAIIGYILVYIVCICILSVSAGAKAERRWAEELSGPLYSGIIAFAVFGVLAYGQWVLAGAGLKLLGFGLSIFPIYCLIKFVGVSFAEGGSYFLLAEGKSFIRIERECGKGRYAEVQGDFKKAEELYRAALTGKAKLDGTVYLQLGNLYHKLNRHAEAADAWRSSLKGDLAPEIHIATAIRLGDTLVDHLHNRNEARELWTKTLKKFPKDPSRTGLVERLAHLG